MRFSYSRVGCYETCPYQYQLKYLNKLRTIPDQAANNALYLGLGLHKGIETTVEEGVCEYKKNFYMLTDEQINWSLQLEYWIPKVKELLPDDGSHEVEIKTNDFIGYLDYVHISDNTIMDFKFSNNIANYIESPQLSIYKYYFEILNPNCVIEHLKYMFIPKCFIRQKKTETIIQFRNRLYEELDKLQIQTVEVPYRNSSVTEFINKRNEISAKKVFPKNETNLCSWCNYQLFCKDGIDYEIMNLPSSDRKTVGEITKRTIWLYGRPFVGKTTVADNAPVPLMLNTDGNTSYITAPSINIVDDAKMEGRVIKRTLAWQVFKDAIVELEKKDNDFKTIVVDLMEDVYESCRIYMYDKLKITHESDDSFRAWDRVRTEFLSVIRKFMNLNYENIILISHEDTTKDVTKKSGENITSIKPNIQDKIANKIAGMVGVVGRVVADGEHRTIQFKADEVIFGGGRLNIAETEIPLLWSEIERVFDEANKNNQIKNKGDAV